MVGMQGFLRPLHRSLGHPAKQCCGVIHRQFRTHHRFLTTAATSTQRTSSPNAGKSSKACLRCSVACCNLHQPGYSASVCTERSSQPKTGVQESKDWEIKMLYDGGCPLCMREVNMLRRRDAGGNKIKFVDIDAPNYDPAQNAGISYEEVISYSQAPAEMSGMQITCEAGCTPRPLLFCVCMYTVCSHHSHPFLLWRRAWPIYMQSFLMVK